MRHYSIAGPVEHWKPEKQQGWQHSHGYTVTALHLYGSTKTQSECRRMLTTTQCYSTRLQPIKSMGQHCTVIQPCSIGQFHVTQRGYVLKYTDFISQNSHNKKSTMFTLISTKYMVCGGKEMVKSFSYYY